MRLKTRSSRWQRFSDALTPFAFSILVAVLFLGTGKLSAQIADSKPEFGPDTGKRAFITKPITVPLKIAIPNGATRQVSAGSVVKIMSVNGFLSAYDDIGQFEIDTDQYVVLQRNLDACLNQLDDPSPFTVHFAKGEYFRNLDLHKARLHYQKALNLKPDDSYALLGLALAQPSRELKIKALANVPNKQDTISLFAKTEIARLSGTYEDLEAISRRPEAPVLAHLERFAFVLLRDRSLATLERLKEIQDSACQYGSSPRLLNLNAMMQRSGVLKGQIPPQVSADIIVKYSNLALQIDPWYYHAHMTLAEATHSSRLYEKAAEHYEAALRLNPVCLQALKGYTDLLKVTGIESTSTEFGRISKNFNVGQLYAQLSPGKFKNSDLPLDEIENFDLFLHGFCPVNHGGSQPLKMQLLNQSGFIDSTKYLQNMFVPR